MCASSSVAAWPPGRPGVVAVAAPHQRTPARRPLLCSGHPQAAAVSAADGAVRTPAAVPRCYGTLDTAAAVRTVAAGYGRRSCTAQAAGVAMLDGRLSSLPHLGAAPVGGLGRRSGQVCRRPGRPGWLAQPDWPRMRSPPGLTPGLRAVGGALTVAQEAARTSV